MRLKFKVTYKIGDEIKWPYKLRILNCVTNCDAVMALQIVNLYTIYLRVFLGFSFLWLGVEEK